MSRRKLWIGLGLFVVSLIVRAVVLVLVTGVDSPLTGDMGSFHRIAVSFLNGDGWQWSENLKSYRPPLISAELVALYSITGPSTSAARWLMVFTSSLIAPALFWVSLQLAPERLSAAAATGLAWGFYPVAAHYGGLVITENAGALLLVLSLGAYLWASQSASRWPAVITGLLWGLSTLNRPVFLLLPFVMLGFQLLLARARDVKWKWTRDRWAVGLVVAMLTLAPWTIRNYRVHGVFMPLTSGTGWMMAMCNGTLSHPTVQAGGYYKNPQVTGQMKGTEVEWNRSGTKLALEEIKRNWRLLPRAVAGRALHFWTPKPDPYEPMWDWKDRIVLAAWVPMMSLFVVSFFFQPWRKDWPALVMILYAFLLTLPFWGTPRFRFPVDPFIILRATGGAALAVGSLRRAFGAPKGVRRSP